MKLSPPQQKLYDDLLIKSDGSGTAKIEYGIGVWQSAVALERKGFIRIVGKIKDQKFKVQLVNTNEEKSWSLHNNSKAYWQICNKPGLIINYRLDAASPVPRKS
jgi:hypothetical protein